MSSMILPGVYITEHAEGLITPGQITIGNLGVIGTAAKGQVLQPVLLGSLQDAINEFYTYDAWIDSNTGLPNPNALTLVRALEQAFEFGATTVYAVRVTKTDAASGQTTAVAASVPLKSATGVLRDPDGQPARHVGQSALAEGRNAKGNRTIRQLGKGSALGAASVQAAPQDRFAEP